jgi:hypothetical protein
MDSSRARTILATLADGVHPISGEVFSPESPYQHAEVVRALYCALRSLETASARPDTQLPQGREADSWRADSRTLAATPSASAATVPPPSVKQNAGKPWSNSEEQELLSKFDAGTTVADLAKQHARSVAGIEARLEKLGRLKPEQRTTVSRYPNGSSRERRAE